MEFHEAANIFPLLEDEALVALADDIRKNGLQIPIELFEEKILDGRNRQTACLLAKVDPDYIEVDPDDPVAYVLSMNLHRRHLKESQRAMVGDAVKDYYAAKAKERQKRKPQSVPANLPEQTGDARDQAGAAVGVSGKLIDAATKVRGKKGSKALQDAVTSGKLPVSSAAKLVDLPKAEQTRIAKSKNPAAEARKAVAPTKPTKDYARIFGDALTEISERLDSVVEQYGSFTKMFDAWESSDCYYAISMLHELNSLLDRFDKEAQGYAKAKGLEEPE